MPSKRVVVWGLGAVVAAVAVVAATLVLAHDDAASVRGDLIAYSCQEPGNDWAAICVMRADGTEKRRLTTQLPTGDPAWSPDGRTIAFTRREDVGEYSTFSHDDVYVMPADGGEPHRVTQDRGRRYSGQPIWSPDGNLIAFVRGSAVATSYIGRPGDIHVMNPDGSSAWRLTSNGPDTDPAWSPDGSEIAFSRLYSYRSSGTADIYVVSAAGGEARRLTHTPGYIESAPAWSPDGSRIVFSRSTPTTLYDGNAALYVMNRNGGGLRLLLTHRHFARNPGNLAWSPDGRTIAFETSPAIGCTAIAVIDVTGGGIRRLTKCTGTSGSALSPAWQPAGS